MIQVSFTYHRPNGCAFLRCLYPDAAIFALITAATFLP